MLRNRFRCNDRLWRFKTNKQTDKLVYCNCIRQLVRFRTVFSGYHLVASSLPVPRATFATVPDAENVGVSWTDNRKRGLVVSRQLTGRWRLFPVDQKKSDAEIFACWRRRVCFHACVCGERVIYYCNAAVRLSSVSPSSFLFSVWLCLC